MGFSADEDTFGRCLGGSVKHPTSAQVVISLFVSLSLHWGSVLTADSPQEILLPPLSVPSPLLTVPLYVQNGMEWNGMEWNGME